jgi:hypothetical protein
MEEAHKFSKLLAYLRRVPALSGSIGHGRAADGNWWVKFALDLSHPLAWNVVQEFGCVFNYLSVNERLPTVFMPVSPAPYLNGGPAEFLSWVVESRDPSISPDEVESVLEGRLPRPVDCLDGWEACP